MSKVPSVVWVAAISCVTLVLNFLMQYFGVGGEGSSYEYATIISVSAFTLLRVIDVFKTQIPSEAKGFIGLSAQRSRLVRIILGD